MYTSILNKNIKINKKPFFFNERGLDSIKLNDLTLEDNMRRKFTFQGMSYFKDFTEHILKSFVYFALKIQAYVYI